MTQEDPFADVHWLWMNGRLEAFEDAKIHVLSHALHYGSGAFEGIRCYSTPAGPAVFRLREHLERLERSAKIFRMRAPFGVGELEAAVIETILANEFGACYVRPLVYRGYGPLGVLPNANPVDVAIAVWPWGAYLGDEALEHGVDVCISTWRRAAPSTYPSLAKLTGSYVSSQLIKMEAVENGYAEGIALDVQGQVSEGSGENLFAVVGGKLLTPPASCTLLPGITRDSILALAADLGIAAEERNLPRELLYVCDELFFTGTAAEVTPIRSVDRIEIGSGRPGPVTRRLMSEYLGIARGEIEDRHGWLSPVAERVPA